MRRKIPIFFWSPISKGFFRKGKDTPKFLGNFFQNRIKFGALAFNFLLQVNSKVVEKNLFIDTSLRKSIKTPPKISNYLKNMKLDNFSFIITFSFCYSTSTRFTAYTIVSIRNKKISSNLIINIFMLFQISFLYVREREEGKYKKRN